MAGPCISNSLDSFSEIDSISCCFFLLFSPFIFLTCFLMLSSQHAAQPAGWCSPSRLVGLTLESSTNKPIYLLTPFLQDVYENCLSPGPALPLSLHRRVGLPVRTLRPSPPSVTSPFKGLGCPGSGLWHLLSALCCLLDVISRADGGSNSPTKDPV